MKSRLRVIVIAATTSVVVGIAAGFATAGDSGVSASRQATKLTPGSYKVNTTMNTKLEVPRPKGTTSGTGTFKATLKVVSATKASLTWKLSFAHLTGPALAAHVHLGAPGKAGKVVVPLCGPCRSGRGGDELGHGCRRRRNDRRQGVRQRSHEGEPQRRDPRHGEGEPPPAAGPQPTRTPTSPSR